MIPRALLRTIHGAFSSLVLCGLILVAATAALAQATSGTITGVVKDESGNALAGASVVITNVATGSIRTVVSDSAGLYRAPGLSLAEYTVRAEHDGFQPVVRKGITLTIGQDAVIDFEMKVGQVSEEIVVSGVPPAVETTNSTLSMLVDAKKIRDLPLNGRNWAQLVALDTGVQVFQNVTPQTAFPGAGRGLRLSIDGARPEFNSFIIDGTDVNDAYSNAPGGASGEFLGIDSLREFRVLTHTYSAEYGRVAGGIVIATTRSGSNEFHGSAFEFLRNSALDAKNFFDLPNKAIPQFKRNQFGATFGGPIVKDKTFFFVSYEGLRERKGTTNTASVPSASARDGIINGRKIPIDPRVKPFLDLYPLPNVPGALELGGGTGLFTFSFKQPARTDFFNTRVDHQLSAKDTIFASYTFADTDTALTLPLPVSKTLQNSRDQYATIEYQRILTPRLLNTVHFGFNRSLLGAIDESRVDLDPARGLKPFIPGKPLGIINISGISTLGPTTFNPTVTRLNLYQVRDDATYTLGSHFLKGGFEFKRFQVNDFNSLVDPGLFQFFSLADFLRARPQAFLGLDPKSDITRGFRQAMIGFYIQDDYKFRPNLTLNLGLRYEFVTIPHDDRGRTANFRNPLTATAPTIGPPTRNPSLKNYAPRFGFAWDVFKNGKTAVRGGFGLFYNQPGYNLYFRSFLFNPPFISFTALPGFVVGRFFPTIPEPLFRPNLVNPLEFNLNTPYTEQYNLNIQHEIPGGIVLSAGFVGSRGIHLPRPTELNFNKPKILPNGTLFFSPKPVPGGVIRNNPNFVSLLDVDTGGKSWYNALAVSAKKSWDRGLQFQVSYTVAKSIDDSPPILRDVETSGTLLLNYAATGLDKSLSNFDKRQNLTANFTYDLPIGRGKAFFSSLTGAKEKVFGGWQLGGIITVTTGSPFTIENGFDRARTGQIGPFRTDRPNVAPGVKGFTTTGDPARFFDPKQFVLQPAGFLGNAGRNIITGPGLKDVDFIVVKSTSIRERLNVEFRTEFFNLFNHPNFATPDNFGRFAFLGAGPEAGADGIPNPQAGRITRTVTTSRQIQFALKLIF